MCQERNKINNEIDDKKLIDSWAGKVGYQIYIDRFYRGDNPKTKIRNYNYYGEPVENVEDWNSPINEFDVRRFYQGSIQGVIDKLDYLQDLGIEFIYLNPAFVSPSNHKYDTQDYNYIDPFIGKIINNHGWDYQKIVTDHVNLEASNQLLIELIQKAHDRGIKIMLDFVLNHCGSFNKWLNKEGIYDKFEEKHQYFKWNDKGEYLGWWNHDTLPKLNYEENKELMDEIINIAVKWVENGVDGIRLDVAADLGFSKEFNHYFWREFRKSVKQANPNTIILAEHYGNPSDWLKDKDQWDTIMNYDAFMEPVSYFFTGMQKHSDDYRSDLDGNADYFEWAMIHANSRMPLSAIQTSMNQLSNHDHSRFLTRTNKQVGRLHYKGSKAAEEGINKGIFRSAVVCQMTWVGNPTLYYGDEAGVCGWTDPDNRRTYPWGREDVELIWFHKEIINIRKSHQALKTGDTKILFKHNDKKLLAYSRYNENDKFVIAFNNNNKTNTYKIKVDSIGIKENIKMQVLIMTDEKGYVLGGENLPVVDGHVEITLPPYSSIVMKN